MVIHKYFSRKDGFVLPTIHMCRDSKREVDKANDGVCVYHTAARMLYSYIISFSDMAWQYCQIRKSPISKKLTFWVISPNLMPAKFSRYMVLPILRV